MPKELFTAVFEIIILWFLFYQLYRAFKDSRGAAILVGLVGIVIGGSILLELFQASVLKHIVHSFAALGTILAILFQPELRTALAKLGSRSIVGSLWNKDDSSEFVDEVVESVSYLVSKRYGALIVISRKNKLNQQDILGVSIDAKYSRELVGTIFKPKTLLHDGAVIIENERITYAAAILPISNKEFKDKSMGMRHRAGIGLAEICDAVVIIVSEETGAVSIAVGTSVQRNVDISYLKHSLNQLLHVTPDYEQN